MGNTQSQSALEHHHKLVKSRTTANVPRVDSQSSLAPRHLSPSERQQIKSQLLSPLETEFECSSEEHPGLGELAASVKRRNSLRTNSMSCFGSVRNPSSRLKSLPSSKVSLVGSHDVDWETAMKMLEDVKRTASPEDLAALQQALQSCQPSPSPGPTATDQNISCRSSILNRSTSSLFRRRSLMAAPGLATRDTTTEKNRRTWSSWRTPQMDPEEEAKWRVDKVGVSPLSKLTARDVAEEKERSSTPRAQTPGEMEYSHLGSLRLGSLRIANGPPSPAASTRFDQQNQPSDISREEDYFTPTEPSDTLMMKPSKRQGHTRSKSAATPTSPPLYRKLRLSTAARRAKTVSRVDSPVKIEPLANEEPSAPQMHDNLEPEPIRRLRVMNKSADTLATISTMAREYQAEPSQQDEAQKHASFREEAFQILHGTIFGEPLSTVDSAQHETPPPVIAQPQENDQKAPAEASMSRLEPKKRKADRKRPPPKQADSGYASEGSSMTMQAKALREGSSSLTTHPSNAADGFSCESSTTGKEACTVEQTLCDPASQKPLHSSPAVENMQRQDSLKTSPVESRPASLHTQRHAEYASLSPASPVARAVSYHAPEISSPQTPVSIVSRFSIDSKNSLSKRLQKRQSSYQELPLVQTCEPILERTIPSIPDEVKRQFVRRMSETPGMECLMQTYPSRDRVVDNESKAESVVAVPAKFPSPPKGPEHRSRHHTRSSTERPPTPSPSGLRRSLSLFLSKSKSRKEHEKEVARERVNMPAVINLGTIAGSLGQSPYDAAMSPAPKRTNTAPKHPHQVGNAMPRTRSMVSMDAQTAAEFARTRSKNRASLHPEMPQRPKSHHDYNIDAGEGSIQRRRSRSSYGGDIPPVPTLQRRPSTASAAAPEVSVNSPVLNQAKSGSKVRARSTGRGRVVSEMVTKYDRYGQSRPSKEEWEAYAKLQSQRRKSAEQQVRRGQRLYTMDSGSQPVSDQTCSYAGYGAPTRQLHSYVNRRSTHYSEHHGVDLFNVPVSFQRA
ncbi:hypothetical protein CC80DRAFT_256072 [Byssothecium circinans]|uniref:Uncharacterized protein n=1 Tax=Byssothecium circinans TaxID=147558 RepID=A0A6A5TA71_9PLEO|nr:hypothetical protein CC80DRAFT_256072 [Byssothecium circinans]